jgi:hypothetical protein
MTGLMKVDLLATEGQRPPVVPEGYDFHSQHLGVKLAGSGNVLHGQNQMVQTIDLHQFFTSRDKFRRNDGKRAFGIFASSSSLTFGHFY